MYSAFGVLLQFARGEDDDINTVLAGGATGLLYKSTGKSNAFCKSSILDFNVNYYFCSWSQEMFDWRRCWTCNKCSMGCIYVVRRIIKKV